MAKSLNTAGMSELDALKRRVTRQYSLQRISRTDHDALIEMINALEVRITQTYEEGGDLSGEE